MDFDRFAKVLALVGSSADGEALAALRTARQMLERAGLSFTDLADAARNGFTAPSPDEVEALEETMRGLRRQVRELKAQLRNRPVGPASTLAAAAPDSRMTADIAELRRDNRGLRGEVRRLQTRLETLEAEKVRQQEQLQVALEGRREAEAARRKSEQSLRKAHADRVAMLSHMQEVVAFLRESGRRTPHVPLPSFWADLVSDPAPDRADTHHARYRAGSGLDAAE